MSEALAALAFVARREGQANLPASRWAHVMALELRWMGPGDAKVFVQRAIDAGLLVPDGEDLRLCRDPRSIEVPRNLRPTRDTPMDAVALDPFLEAVDALAQDLGTSREAALSQVTATQEAFGGLLSADVAVQYVRRWKEAP